VSDDVDWSLVHDLHIVHVGQSGTLLSHGASGDRVLVPLTFGDRGLVPGGLHVSPADAPSVRAALSRAAGRGRRVDLTGWGCVANPAIDLRLQAVAVSEAAVDAFTSGLRHVVLAGPVAPSPAMDPSAQRRLAGPLAAAAADGLDAVPILAELIGAGPGSTPAGDDVVVGVLAGLDVAGRAGLLDPDSRERVGELRTEVVRISAQTTFLSRHDLRAAADGRFCERVHRLVEALADAESAMRVVAEAAGWGATSGVDLAHGVLAACRPVRPGSAGLARVA
jgi:hypothetical protein